MHNKIDRRPTNMRSVRIYCRDSCNRYPMPEDAPDNSAATRLRNASATPSRSPAMMAGAAAGMITVKNSRMRDAPSVREART